MAQSKSEGLQLYFETPKHAGPSLQQHVGQLLQQRGALRHITKGTLLQEVERSSTLENGVSGDVVEVQDASDSETPQARQESLWKAREEMLQKLAYAQNEILSALDFVSLLLSGNSVAAQTSMSPALKQHVPTGTLEKHVVQRQDTPTASRQKLSQVSEGWKSESFQNSSSKFAKAAVRLDTEASRQSRYWDQIARLKTYGWSISRLPSDSRTIGVHYGFPESAPQFRTRGFALLQQDESGSLQLDSRSASHTATGTRIVIVRRGTETGASRVKTPNWHRGDIVEQVNQARDAIFEEELFHEISREARLIANQGARTQPNAIEADIDTHVQIRIELVDLAEVNNNSSANSDDQLAESIALNLRLLLLLEHSRSREKRSQRPPVMSLTQSALSEYAILRPVLANLRHQASLLALRGIGASLGETFEVAELHFSYQMAQMQTAEKVVGIQGLRSPVRSLLTACVGNGRKIEIEVETYLGAPIYGTAFRSHDLDFGFVVFPAGHFNTIDEAAEYLAHALTLELMSQSPEFEILRPHSGEIAFKGSRRTTAVVSVRPQRVSLLVTEPSKVMYSWRPSGFQCMPAGEIESGSFGSIVKMMNSLM